MKRTKENAGSGRCKGGERKDMFDVIASKGEKKESYNGIK